MQCLTDVNKRVIKNIFCFAQVEFECTVPSQTPTPPPPCCLHPSPSFIALFPLSLPHLSPPSSLHPQPCPAQPTPCPDPAGPLGCSCDQAVTRLRQRLSVTPTEVTPLPGGCAGPWMESSERQTRCRDPDALTSAWACPLAEQRSQRRERPNQPPAPKPAPLSLPPAPGHRQYCCDGCH